MQLHVYENPDMGHGGGADPLSVVGTNVWVTDVPEDFTDADVKYNIEQWAASGDKVAKRALDLVPGYWLAYSGALDYPRVRVYLDE